MRKPLEIFFDEEGNLLNRVYNPIYHNSGYQYKKEDNSVFFDKLEYVDYMSAGKGGDSKIIFKSLNSGRTYYMFISDFHDVLVNKLFVNNVIDNRFTFCKRGSSQGIKVIKEKNNEAIR